MEGAALKGGWIRILFLAQARKKRAILQSGHLLPVKVTTSLAATQTSHSLSFSIFSTNPNKYKSEQASTLISLDLRGFPVIHWAICSNKKGVTVTRDIRKKGH